MQPLYMSRSGLSSFPFFGGSAEDVLPSVGVVALSFTLSVGDAFGFGHTIFVPAQVDISKIYKALNQVKMWSYEPKLKRLAH